MPQNFVASYTYALPVDQWLHRRDRLTQGWSIGGTARFSSGFPVTLSDVSDNSLLGTLGNGVNNQLLDTPQVVSGQPLNLNTNPRNNPYAFNANAFAPEALGQLGDADRRSFQGPGIENFDVQLSKSVRCCGNLNRWTFASKRSMYSTTLSFMARLQWMERSTIPTSAGL